MFEQYLQHNLPGTVYYIPGFITEEEESYLIRHVNSAPKPKWTQLLNRRLQNWGGLPHEKGMIKETIPEWLKIYTDKISSLGAFESNEANHVLINEYHPGQGIMPHLDGSLYYPTVTTISLGGHTVLKYYKQRDAESTVEIAKDSDAENKDNEWCARHIGSVLLQPRSLLIVKESMYTDYLHGIEECSEDTVDETIVNCQQAQVKMGDKLKRGTRLSLTIRYVPKVLKSKLFFNKR